MRWSDNKQKGYYDNGLEDPKQQCFHDNCPECHGTGRKANGEACVHMISCPCPKCSPRC